MNQKSNKIIIILLILLLVSIAGTVYFYLNYTNIKNNRGTTNNNSTTPSSKYEIKKLDYDIDNKNEQTLKVGDLIIKIKPYNYIKVNDKEIGKNIYYAEIYNFDNNLIIISSGTDIRDTTVYIVDKNGQVVKEIWELDEKYSYMVIADAAEDSIKFTNDGLKFYGTRLTHGPTFAYLWNNDDFDPMSNDLSDCANFKKHENEVAFGTYEIKYLGNGLWSNIRNIDYTLLKNSDVKCNS